MDNKYHALSSARFSFVARRSAGIIYIIPGCPKHRSDSQIYFSTVSCKCSSHCGAALRHASVSLVGFRIVALPHINDKPSKRTLRKTAKVDVIGVLEGRPRNNNVSTK